MGPDESLYIDEQGRRVIFAADEPALLAVTPQSGAPFRSDFGSEGGTLVVEGPARVLARLGGDCPLREPDWQPFSGYVIGRGWVAKGSHVSHADRHKLDGPAPFDLPFHVSCRIDGRLWLGPKATTLDYFGFVCDDPAERARFDFRAEGETAVYHLANGPYRSHLGPARFRIQLPDHCIGLELEKGYDRFFGRQRARVWVDGEFAGVWSAYEEDRVHRRSYTDFPVPRRFVEGKSSVEVCIDPPAGSPLWNWSDIFYRALTIFV